MPFKTTAPSVMNAVAVCNLIKNLGFVVKHVPFAATKAEDQFNKAIKVANEIGARGIMRQACLDLGILYKEKKDPLRQGSASLKLLRILTNAAPESFYNMQKNV
jgi:hypothetical protein